MPVHFKVGEDLCDSTQSETSFIQAEKWIDQCKSSHRKCSQANSFLWFPTRVVDVSGDPDWAKLVISNSDHANQRYLTLSHCWGKTPTIYCTADSISRFTKGILVSAMPATFRDAITVTRRLEYRYLWIDSLCIIQDSEEDWRKESAMMGKIYKFSQCTIAATRSANSHESFFTRRSAFELQPCRIFGNVLSPQKELEEMYLYNRQDCMWDDIFKAPLHSRAWVLQERLLSPRVLHYTSRQLFWECQELDACEAFPQGLNLDYNSVNTAGSWYFKRIMGRPIEPDGRHTWQDGFTPRDTLYADWNFIVETYSTAQLTKAKDKLVAISGLAHEWSYRVNEMYLAGLWRGDLHRQLLWHMELLLENSRRRAALYRAPTWSWACFDARVYNEVMAESLSDCVTIGQFTSVQVISTGPDTMGEISFAQLEIRGPLRTTELLKDESGFYYLPNISEGYSDEHIENGGRYSICNPDIDLIQLKGVTCLPLVQISESRSEPTVDGLLLTPIVLGENVFERVGTFQLSGEHACRFFDGCIEQIIMIK